jgi:hypothetical protein
MPSIEQVVQVGDADDNGAANYVVTVAPDKNKPGHGIVSDSTGRSSPWDSATGDPVKTTIHGAPPFVARQFQMTFSAAVGPTHLASEPVPLPKRGPRGARK